MIGKLLPSLRSHVGPAYPSTPFGLSYGSILLHICKSSIIVGTVQPVKGTLIDDDGILVKSPIIICF
jgi:hypothetical protein